MRPVACSMRGAVVAACSTMSLWLAALGFVGCEEKKGVAPNTPAGLPADVISTAVREVDFMRAWAELTLDNWQRSGGPPGAGWHYVAESSAWQQEWSGSSRMIIGSGTTAGSGEVHDAFTQSLEVRLFRGPAPVRDYAEADRLSMDLVQQLNRYSVPEGFPLDDPHYYFTGGTFRVEDLRGQRRVIAGAGEQRGRDRLRSEGAWRDYRYLTTFDLRVAGAASAPFCAAETLSATVAVRDTTNVMLDRFAGRFMSAAGGDWYGGPLVSEQGPWQFSISGHRSCAEPPHAWAGTAAKY